MTMARPIRLVFRALAAVLLLLLAAAGATSLRVGGPPVVSLRPGLPAVGRRTPVVLSAAAPGRGLVRLRLELEQAGRVHVLAERRYRPLPPWALAGERTETDEIRLEVGAATTPGLKEGEAVLRAVADRAGTWLLRPAPVTVEVRLPVRLRPPALSLLSSQHYVAQGGAGVVVYRVGPTSVRDGVQAGEWFFPGAALPGGGPSDRFALFGVPWTLSSGARVRLVASDEVDNRSELAFVDRFFPHPPARDRIALEDTFLERVVPEILRQTPELADRGSLLANYLEVNRDLRRRNAEELAALAPRSVPRFLWREAFLPLRGAKVMSSFADRRSYLYQGREVDEQTHLGFDLASVARTPVPAANRGVVVLARYFGIYGNAVVLDHGYGLMSLYAHLSEISVAEGQEVERAAILGTTGKTGLAGGDHLHFTTLVGGLPVNPKEWWDPKWVRDRVTSKLGTTLAAEATGGG